MFFPQNAGQQLASASHRREHRQREYERLQGFPGLVRRELQQHHAAGVAFERNLQQAGSNTAQPIHDLNAALVSFLVTGLPIFASVAGTMIAQAAQAMEFGATSEDIAYTCHAHPTHAEAFKEAAMAVTGKPIHM